MGPSASLTIESTLPRLRLSARVKVLAIVPLPANTAAPVFTLTGPLTVPLPPKTAPTVFTITRVLLVPELPPTSNVPAVIKVIPV